VQTHGDGIIRHHEALDLLFAEQLHNIRIGKAIGSVAKQSQDPGNRQYQNAQIQDHRKQTTFLQNGYALLFRSFRVQHANIGKKQLPIHALTNHRSWNAKL